MLYLKLVDKDLPEVFYIFFKFQKFGLVWLQKKYLMVKSIHLKKVSYGHSRLYFFD